MNRSTCLDRLDFLFIVFDILTSSADYTNIETIQKFEVGNIFNNPPPPPFLKCWIFLSLLGSPRLHLFDQNTVNH